ncbi:hypothetical protein SBRCBS47491_008283 [Sporothrix bragantina]|uniref:D-xylose 1-dehydrogenase (NADP(+), D-xylono-1,5-lactone-forming) n=1 Tax=Sporothrix bragantina TaxID=671064 RepID=A0ABP0CKU6_9PEZI
MATTPASAAHTTRWGILATGWMASVFTKDLLGDPAIRGVADVRHEVVAVASSTSAARAQKFIDDHGATATATAYGSYEDLVNDPRVDVVYIATPHSHHYQNAMLALTAGKPVLVEKAFTTNATQARKLVETARAKNLFLMEALWTRYFPLADEVRKTVAAGTIGAVQRVTADSSFGENVEEKWGTENRIINLDLAGGALLDLGVYALAWVFQILYHLQPVPRQPPTVASSVIKYPATGADEQTAVLLTFPVGPAVDSTSEGQGNTTQGIATCGIRAGMDPDLKGTVGAPIRIQGTHGELQVFGPTFRPTTYRLVPKLDTLTGKPVGPLKEGKDVEHAIPGPGTENGGHGMYWEADEVARCLRDGKQQSAIMDWEETIVIMDVMDTVRKQNGIVYPESIETTDYPVKL